LFRMVVSHHVVAGGCQRFFGLPRELNYSWL
jgi:hypothetical protein